LGGEGARCVALCRSSRFFPQLARYTVVGGFAAVLDIGTFAVLTTLCGIGYLIANTAAITLGLIVNYLLSSTWVFQQKKLNIRRDFLPFAVIGIIGLGIQNVLLYILLDKQLAFTVNTSFGFGSNAVLLGSKIFVVGITFLWNFIVRKFLVYDRNN
jgi:putative flippase GtrA